MIGNPSLSPSARFIWSAGGTLPPACLLACRGGAMEGAANGNGGRSVRLRELPELEHKGVRVDTREALNNTFFSSSMENKLSVMAPDETSG